jgi:hypothetical protein
MSSQNCNGNRLSLHALPKVLLCALAAAFYGGCGGEMPQEDVAQSEQAAESWSGWFEVNVGGVWKGVSCSGSTPGLRVDGRRWDVSSDRVLKHTAHGKRLKCPEGAVDRECTCTTGSGERMHGTTPGSRRATGPVQLSLSQRNGAWIFADLDSGWSDVCVRAENGRLIQRRGNCHNFRLRR